MLGSVRSGIMALCLWCVPFVSAADTLPVLVETDMGNDIDDALALDLLYKAMDDGKTRILGIGNHKLTDTASDYIDILNTWYGYPDIPVGKSTTPIASADGVDYTAFVTQMKDDDGTHLFPRSKGPDRYEDPVTMYRRLLAVQPDSSVVFVSLGFATELAKLLDSEPDSYSALAGRDLVARKVKFLSVMAGSYGEHKIAEFNVVKDIAAMRKVFEEWPTAIVQNPFEIGVSVLYPSSVIDGWCSAELNPVAEGYKVYSEMPYDRPAWDLLSVVYLTHPELFSESRPGTVSVDDSGFTCFDDGGTGSHTVLSADGEQCRLLREHIVRQALRVAAYRQNRR